MKTFLKISAAIILLIAIVLVVSGITLNSIIQTGVETIGPKITGTPVNLEDVDLSLFSGQGRLVGLVVKNPQGFQTDHAFKLQDVYVSIDLKSALSDKLVIEEISIESPEITFEGDLSSSNLGKIRENVDTFGDSTTSKEPREAMPQEKESSEQKVQIDHFIVKNAQVKLSATFLKGDALTVSLPDLHLRDIGKGSRGATLQEISSQVFEAIYKSIVQTVPGAKKFMKKGLEKVEETIKGMSSGEEKMGSKVLEGVKGILGR